MTVRELIARLQQPDVPQDGLVWVDTEEYGLCGVGDDVEVVHVSGYGASVLIGGWIEDDEDENGPHVTVTPERS